MHEMRNRTGQVFSLRTSYPPIIRTATLRREDEGQVICVILSRIYPLSTSGYSDGSMEILAVNVMPKPSA